MELTLSIDLAHTSATLVEKHSFVAGDVYNPLYLDFSNLTPSQLAAIDTGSLVLTLRKGGASGAIVASTNLFSAASRLATNGTATPLPKMRQTTLPLNVQEVSDWFAEASSAENPDLSAVAFLEISDANVTYAACQVPFLLRSFTVGGSNPGYYTKEEINALLARKQDTVTAVPPITKTGSSVSVNVASRTAAGVVKVGQRLSISPDGTMSADDQTPTTDDTLDTGSTNPVQNKPVAEAISGLANRLTEIDGDGGALRQLVDAVSVKADDSALKTVAKTGSYNDLTDKPAIPSADAIGNKWTTGTAITGTSTNPTQFPSSGVLSANAGDMYLNSETSAVYRCTTGGAPSTALWAYVCSLRGLPGAAGLSGQIKAVYSSVSAMQTAWATDSLQTGELAIVNTGNVSDEDNGKLYRKGSAQYEYLCDLSGTPGTRWFTGTGVTGTSTTPSVFPSSGIVASAGDLYVNTSTSAYYRCTVGGPSDTAKWAFAGSLKGAKGDDGDDGAAGALWYAGTDITGTSSGARFPSSGVADAHVGDKYLNTSTGNVYDCVQAGTPVSALWSYIASLKGAAGDDGADGATWKFGTEVSGDAPGAVTVVGGASVGDCYLNTSTGGCYLCTSMFGETPVWTLKGTLRGEVGTPGTDGTSWHHGTTLSGTGTVEGSVSDGIPLHAGDMYFNTSTFMVYVCSTATTDTFGTWNYLCTITSSGVTAPLSHTPGYIPAWGTEGNALVNGYAVASTVRSRDSASATMIPTEYAVALALSGLVVAPVSHQGGTLLAWGDAASNTASGEYSVRKTTNGGIREAAYASDSAIPTEKAIRSALDALEDSFSNKRLDQMAAPLAGSTRLDATTAVHGLLSALDKQKLDGMASYSTAEDIGEDIAGTDTFIVYNASESNFPRLASMARLWAYIRSVLPTYRLDDLAVPEDNTDLNASIDHHGLLPKLPAVNGERKVLSGTGEWVENEAANTFIGDSGAGGTRGQVPAPAAGDAAAAKFLCADGRWSVVPGGQQYSAWTFSDGGSWALAWDEDAGAWTVTDGTHDGTMSGTYARTATTVFFSWDDSGTIRTVTATRTATSGVSIHSLPEVLSLAGNDEFLVHDTSAGSQGKVTFAALAALVNSFDRYETLFVPAGAMTPSESDGASVVEIYVSGNQTTHDAMRFPYQSGVATGVDFNIALPDDWDRGTIKAKLVWRLSAMNSASPGQNVKFALAAAAYGDTEDYSSVLGTPVVVTDSVHGTSEMHITPATPALTVGGTPAAGKMIHFKVTRTFESIGDSCAADVNLLGILFQFRRSGTSVAW